MSELSTRPPRPVVGVEMPHESADLHVTGLALYTDDLVSRYPGTLHAYPVQAPHAHAHIRSMDTAPARRSRGHAPVTSTIVEATPPPTRPPSR